MRKSRRLGNTWNNQKCKESHFQKNKGVSF